MPSFTAQLGTFDFAPYLRVSPDEGLDPYTAAVEEPLFADAAFADGQPLMGVDVRNREQAWPLYLRSTTGKDALHTLAAQLRLVCRQEDLTLTWQDAGATRATYYDVAWARFEPAFNFRRSEKGWLAGVLRVYCRPPYGHTATSSILATLAATGQVAVVSLGASSIAGDVDALADVRVKIGSAVPFAWLVAVAPIPPGGYQPIIPAGSITTLQSFGAAGTLIGASGLHASQGRLFYAGDDKGLTQMARIDVSPASAYEGRNRVLAFVRFEADVSFGAQRAALRAFTREGEPIGPTALATGWPYDGVRPVDLGVWSVPRVRLGEATASLELRVGAYGGDFDTPGAGLASHMLLDKVVLLPEERMRVVLDSDRRAVGMHPEKTMALASGQSLLGRYDVFGNVWATAMIGASPAAGLRNRSPAGGVASTFPTVPSGGSLGAAVLNSPDVEDFFGEAEFSLANAIGGYVELAKYIGPTAYLSARVVATPGAFSLHTVQGNTETLVASRSWVTRPAFFRIELTANGSEFYGGGWRSTGSLGASLGAASAALQRLPGKLAVFMTNPTTTIAHTVYKARLTERADVAPAARALYHLDAVSGRDWRTDASDLVVSDQAAHVMGPPLQVPPDAAGIVVVAAGIPGSPGNGQMGIDVRIRERFTFAR